MKRRKERLLRRPVEKCRRSEPERKRDSEAPKKGYGRRQLRSAAQIKLKKTTTDMTT